MLSYTIERVLSLIPTLFIVPVVIFLVVCMIPGGLAIAFLGVEATPEVIADLDAQLGFDRPFFMQYADWFMGMLHGDWGQSYFLQTTVLDAIGEYFVPTFSLAVFAQLISLVIVAPAGILAIYKRGTSVDIITVSVPLLGTAIPDLLLGVFLILLSGVYLKWLPVAGYVQLSRGLLEHLRYLLLPALLLGIVQTACITRMPWSTMLDVLYMNYICTVRAKGPRESTVVLVYGLKNVDPVMLTVTGRPFGSLVVGTIVTETLFSIPGLGMLTVTPITRRNVFVIQGVVLFVILIYMLVSPAVDILYGFVDPRI